MMKRRIGVVCILLLSLALVGCSDDEADCRSVCDKAQDQNCTDILDCADFCSSTLALRDTASCQSEYDAYHDCAMSTSTCTISAQCASEESALLGCITPYCYVNATDPDCIKLDSSI